jgi:hypothetical protein
VSRLSVLTINIRSNHVSPRYSCFLHVVHHHCLQDACTSASHIVLALPVPKENNKGSCRSSSYTNSFRYICSKSFKCSECVLPIEPDTSTGWAKLPSPLIHMHLHKNHSIRTLDHCGSIDVQHNYHLILLDLITQAVCDHCDKATLLHFTNKVLFCSPELSML